MIDAVITVLGLVGNRKRENYIEDGEIHTRFVEKGDKDRARYYFGPRLRDSFSLSNERYINTLPILCELFGEERVVPIGTQKAREIQSEVLKAEGFADTFLEREDGYIEDEKNFTAIFSTINSLLYEYEKVVVDITHGFRHLPILMTISLIVENIKNTEKVEHIFFAREIEAGREYEIIDLKEYLDVANISFALASFNNNYTVAHHIRCSSPVYSELIDNLSRFSEHILANSILELYRNENSVVERILRLLESLEDDEIMGLQTYLAPVKLHLRSLVLLRNQPEYKQLFHLSKKLTAKGYYLNAVTLLDEAIGHYCVERFRGYSKSIADGLDDFLKTDNSKAVKYELSKQSKNLVKHMENMNGAYLKQSREERMTSGQRSRLQERKKKIKARIDPLVFAELNRFGLKMEFSKIKAGADNGLKLEILKFLKDREFLTEFRQFIRETDDMRNNLAHANSSESLLQIRERLDNLLERFNELCIDIDVLR